MGLAAGHDQLGLAPELVVPWVSMLAVVLGIVVTANLVVAFPGWLAARIHPAVVLRDEERRPRLRSGPRDGATMTTES